MNASIELCRGWEGRRANDGVRQRDLMLVFSDQIMLTRRNAAPLLEVNESVRVRVYNQQWHPSLSSPYNRYTGQCRPNEGTLEVCAREMRKGIVQAAEKRTIVQRWRRAELTPACLIPVIVCCAFVPV